MAKRPLPSPEELRQLLRYDPETGKLFWLPRTVAMFTDGGKTAEHSCKAWNAKFAGKQAFTALDARGYVSGAIWNATNTAHRVIWALVYGEWLDGEVDHVNGDRADNRLTNLRAATSGQNKHNIGIRVNNTSGYKGVFWNKQCGKWSASIKLRYKTYYLGLFLTKEEASAAYDAAARNLHGEFARLNRFAIQ